MGMAIKVNQVQNTFEQSSWTSENSSKRRFDREAATISTSIESKNPTEMPKRWGIIEKVTQTTDYCVPIVPEKKKNGRVRWCVDLKRFNLEVKRKLNILLNLDDDIATKLHGTPFF